MQKNHGEQGKERRAQYIENAVYNFIRGLDKDTLTFTKDKFPPNLDAAIKLAAEADQEYNGWKRVYNKEIKYSFQNNKKRAIAHINGKKGG